MCANNEIQRAGLNRDGGRDSSAGGGTRCSEDGTRGGDARVAEEVAVVEAAGVA